tara:strand:- start:132 stop:314 length:183 start_codon:yes stop_codon:yes gene_type:complete
MEKIKEIPKIKKNGEKKKLTKDQAIEILEKEIPEDIADLKRRRDKIMGKQGALEILKQID